MYWLQWIRGHIRGDTDGESSVPQKKNTTRMFGFGSNDETGTQIPTQAQSIVEGSGSVMVSEFKPVPDVDYLQVSVMGCNLLFFF